MNGSYTRLTATPCLQDALFVGAPELVWLTSAGLAAARLIRSILAIVDAVANFLLRNALAIHAGGLGQRTS